MQEKDEEAWNQYCMPASHGLIYQSKNLYFILGSEFEDKDDAKEVIAKEEEVKKDKDNGDLVKLFDRLKLLNESGDIGYSKIEMLVEERLIQCMGHLYKYDADSDTNALS